MEQAATVRVPPQGERGPCGFRNRALREALEPWVFLLDHDAEPAPGCLERLLEDAAAHPDASIVSPRVMREGGVIHYDGARCHFSGEACFDNFHRPARDARPPNPWPDAVSTTALLIRREDALAWGLFDEELVFFREDVEFSLRARLFGARIRHCPEAVVWHRQGARGPLHEKRAYYQARNRWRILLTICEGRTLAATLPLQAGFELLAMARSAADGRLMSHLAGLAQAARELPGLIERRRALQASRRRRDRELFGRMRPSWRPETMALPGAALAARLLGSEAD